MSDSEEYSDTDSDAMEDDRRPATVIEAHDVKATIEELKNKRINDAQSAASAERAAVKARAAAAEAAAARFDAANRAAAEQARNPPPVAPGALPPQLQTHKDKLITILLNVKDPMRNTPPVQEQCINTLHSICENALANPNDPKFRKIKCLNKTIMNKVSPCAYGEDFLVAAGFPKLVELNEAFFACGAVTEKNDAQGASGTTATPTTTTTPTNPTPQFNGKSVPPFCFLKINVSEECPVAILRRLEIAKDLLDKASLLAVQKTERWEREKTREKDEIEIQKQRAKEAIREDKERRQLVEERKQAAKKKEAEI